MLRNIDAVQGLAKMTRTALGPGGKLLNKFFPEYSQNMFTRRHEQDGHQSLGKALRHLRRSHDYQ